jgi:hypothetical protein
MYSTSALGRDHEYNSEEVGNDVMCSQIERIRGRIDSYTWMKVIGLWGDSDWLGLSAYGDHIDPTSDRWVDASIPMKVS